ncbi:ERMES complex subunit mmm1 [Coemansia spiralis]|uniref:Maintenance of mitochondrial morphology protein 1 n=1 Tax=Coemansia spiralis TaxID=417178 RepID=A0A9W8G6N2_9FUNG|nr:ERMES complex subunit mmm1 [Coemansia spiralis]
MNELSRLNPLGIPQFVQSIWMWQPTFMQGFILGQISMLVLLIMAIKYILFEEPMGKKPIEGESDANAKPRNSAPEPAEDNKGRTVVQEGGFGLSKFMFFSRKQESKPCDAAEEHARIQKEILSRTGYDLASHTSESCDWLTVFLAQIIAKFRKDAEKHDRLVRVISEALNGELRPSVIDNIRITQFSLGSDFLRIAGARMVPSAGSLGMRAELDLELHDEITLGFNTRVLVNWPRQLVAALPVSMVVSLVKFVGTAAIEFDCSSLEPSVSISILPDYVLEFDVQTLIGSKAKVQNLPMLTSVISRKLEAAFAKELVMPNEKRVKIKHPFTPKAAAAAAGGGASTAASTSAHSGPTPGVAAATAINPQHIPLRSPTLETNRPASPMAPPLVAELPPDYNTQLPPPHHLRSSAHSRAAAGSAANAPTATANINASPLMGMPPRMYTPEDPILLGMHPIRPTTSNIQHNSQHQHQHQQQRAWSPEFGLSTASPQMRPIIGLSSGAGFGPIMANPRIISASGSRIAGTHGSTLFYPPPGLAASFIDSQNIPSATTTGNTATTSNAGYSAPIAVLNKQSEPDSDELQVKDSVRQRVNRVLKTVNES